MYYSPANAGPMVGLPERLNHHLPISIAMAQYFNDDRLLNRI
jgi:hypothetical protein